MSPVPVGILHSKSGTMAISEVPLVEAELMAIAEINQAGGVLGQRIEPVIEDGASDPAIFEAKARELIERDHITTVFGCWTSVTRKAVLPVFEEFNAILWYPMRYEGLESSKNIFYVGSCPNQQIEPAVTWLLQNKRKHFYLLSSDDVFSRTANLIVKAQLKQQGGTVVGEEYIPLGTKDFTEILTRIKQAQPDIIFNTLHGDSNVAFYRQYQKSPIRSDESPILAVSVAEAEVQQIGEAAVGHYAAWSYFQSLGTPNNQRFVQNFQRHYGANRVTSDPIEAAYTQVYLWKQAVELADSFEVERVRVAAYGQTFEAPSGLVRIEPNHHVWKTCRIGRILPTGQFEIIHSSDRPIKPLPWLGVERLKIEGSENNCKLANLQPTFPAQPATPELLCPYNWNAIVDLLAEVSQGIHKAYQLEQKSRELEAAKAQLQDEIAKRQRVEAIVLDSEAELQALFAAMTDLVLVINAQGRYLRIAPTHPARLYKLADTLIGKTLHDVFEPTKADTLLSYIQKALDTQQTVNVEYSCTTFEQQEVWFSASISPISEDSAIWVARDATERKQAEEALRQAEERYHSIFENSDEGLFQVTPEGQYLSANPALAKIYGYKSPEELIASLTSIKRQLYVEPNRQRKLFAFLEANDRVSNLESQIYRKDGSIIWVSENIHVVRDANGELLYYEGSIVDVTQRKVWEEALRYQQACTEDLLLNILPSPIAHRLKLAESTIADSFAEATVLFADLVNFTEMSAQIPATKLVVLLNQIFSQFDLLSEKHGLEKIKTIGDAYMVVGGLPTPRRDHAEAIAEMALEMQQKINRFKRHDGQPFSLRIGINSGPVVAGVIGTKKFTYDLWGDTVNVASRMESQGVAGRIQVTEVTYERLKDKYSFEPRGITLIKGKGEMMTYWLIGRK